MNRVEKLKLLNKSTFELILSKIKFKFNVIKDKIWFKYYLNNNEFSNKLDLNVHKMISMSEEEKIAYVQKITRLRDKAHNLDLNK